MCVKKLDSTCRCLLVLGLLVAAALSGPVSGRVEASGVGIDAKTEPYCFIYGGGEEEEEKLALPAGELAARPPRAKGEGVVWHVRREAGGANSGLSWEDAFVSLRSALEAAHPGDEVWVAAGVHAPTEADGGPLGGSHVFIGFDVAAGVSVYGGFGGNETARAERDPDPFTNGTVLSGDVNGDDGGQWPGGTTSPVFNDNAMSVVRIGAGAVLDGFVVTGGAYIGGVWATGSPGPLLQNLRVVGNRGSAGAGIRLDRSPATLQGVTIENNVSTEVGGGLFAGIAQGVVLRDVTFSGNHANFSGGGAGFCECQATLERVQFLENEVSRGLWGYGGGLYAEGSQLDIRGGRFLGNRAADDGGGVYMDWGSLRMVSTVVAGNTASVGAGLYLYIRMDYFANVLVAGNHAVHSGGGMAVFSDVQPQWNNVTIADNYAGVKGGALILGSMSQVDGREFRNTIVHGNRTGGGAPSMDFSGVPVNRRPVWRQSIVEGSGGSGGAWDATYGVDGGGNLDADPLFAGPLGAAAALASIGAYGLRVGSPGLDSGRNDLLPVDALDVDGDGNTTEVLPLDLAGAARIQGAAVDRGAYEGVYPATLVLPHSADQDGNASFSISELLRVIQLYNSLGHHCAADSEDGYAPGPDPSAQDCAPHSADYAPQDWMIGFSELLRVIQFYNAGAYHPCATGEDGFCPGPGTD